MVDRDGQFAVDPLVMEIIVDPNDVDVFRTTAKLWPSATRNKVESFELRKRILTSGLDVLRTIRARKDVDRRLRPDDPGAPVDIPDGLNSGNRRTHENPF